MGHHNMRAWLDKQASAARVQVQVKISTGQNMLHDVTCNLLGRRTKVITREYPIQVQMVGNIEVSSLLKELREARKPAKNSTFRVK